MKQGREFLLMLAVMIAMVVAVGKWIGATAGLVALNAALAGIWGWIILRWKPLDSAKTGDEK